MSDVTQLPSKDHVHSWHMGQCVPCLLERIALLQAEVVRLETHIIERQPLKVTEIQAQVDERLDRVEQELAKSDLTFVEEASGLIELLESDFGQSGADVRYEAIRCELVAAFNRGKRAAHPPLGEQS